MSLTQYLKDTRGELHHVSWPTRTQTIVYTVLVIGVSIVTALYLGAFDYLFSQGLNRALQLEEAKTVPAQTQTTTDTVPVQSDTPTIQVTPTTSTSTDTTTQ